MHADPYLPIFERTQTIAIVGLSPKPERDSHHVAQYLQAQGFRIVPINPAVDEVLEKTHKDSHNNSNINSRAKTGKSHI